MKNIAYSIIDNTTSQSTIREWIYFNAKIRTEIKENSLLLININTNQVIDLPLNKILSLAMFISESLKLAECKKLNSQFKGSLTMIFENKNEKG